MPNSVFSQESLFSLFKPQVFAENAAQTAGSLGKVRNLSPFDHSPGSNRDDNLVE